jgi:hypothetical protein
MKKESNGISFLAKVIIGAAAMFIVAYFLAIVLFSIVVVSKAKDIDEHGGVKALIERIWEGKKDAQTGKGPGNK